MIRRDGDTRIKKRYPANIWRTGNKVSARVRLVSNTNGREEMRMKSRYRLLLCLLAVSLAANPVFAEDLAGTLKKVKETGTITMGIRESSYPLSYLDDKQQPIGYHIDVCNKIVAAVKDQLKMPGLSCIPRRRHS